MAKDYARTPKQLLDEGYAALTFNATVWRAAMKSKSKMQEMADADRAAGLGGR